MTLVAQYQNGCIMHIVDCLATSQRLKLQIVQQRSKYQETKTIEIPLSPLHHCRRLWEKKPISLWASFPGWCFTEQSSEQPSTLSPFVPHLLLARNHSALILPHTQFHFFAKQMCHTPTHAHTHTYTQARTRTFSQRYRTWTNRLEILYDQENCAFLWFIMMISEKILSTDRSAWW